MLIARCAWHRRYYGFSRILGVSSWRGVRIDFTDGICQKCAARVRSDLAVSRAGGPGPRDRTEWIPGITVVGLAVMVVILLIARPVQHLPAPSQVALRPPAPPPTLVIPEPSPAASPALVPPSRPAPAAPGATRPLPPVWRDDSLAGRRPLPAWRDDALAHRPLPPVWRDEPPARRPLTSVWRDEPPARRPLTPVWRENVVARRSLPVWRDEAPAQRPLPRTTVVSRSRPLRDSVQSP